MFSLFFPMFFYLFFLLFSGAQNPLFFLPRLSHDFLLKLVCKNQMFGQLKRYRIGPSFFLSCLFFYFSFFFHFRFLFTFFPFFFVSLYSFVFLLCSFFFQCFLLFHFVSLFSFLGCSKSVATLQDSLGKSAHYELAFFTFAHFW